LQGRWPVLHCHGTAGRPDAETAYRKQPLEIDVLLDLAIQIADALGSAHAKALFIVTLSPPTSFVTMRNQAKILDFALPNRP